MAVCNFTGFSPSDISFLSGAQMRVDSTYDSTSAYSFEITDDDGAWSGDSETNSIADDPTQQTTVVRDESGTVVASGQSYLEYAKTASDGYGNSVEVYRVMIGTTTVGYVADGQLVPGNTYDWVVTDIEPSNQPSYSEIVSQTFDPDADNTMDGTANGDYQRGYQGADTLEGKGGNDTLEGWEGDDFLHGGDGYDTLYGWHDNDTLVGGNGDDSLLGGSGDDVLYGQEGNDTLDGGAGNDSLRGGVGDDSLLGRTGHDTLAGGEGNDTLEGGAGDDFLYGQEGNDALEGGEGNDSLRGEDGHDTLSGGTGDDTLDGGSSDDALEGGEGHDVLYGDEGDDSLYGDAGNDILYGGTGDDYIDGGADSDQIVFFDGGGNDTVIGGEGGADNDTLDFSGLTSRVTLISTDDEAGTVTYRKDTTTFSQIENVILTDSNDRVDGAADSAGTNIDAGDGNDSVDGGSGKDTIKGGLGNDSIVGNDGDDSLSGGDGSDSIFADGGADTIEGGAGNDSLDGDGGADSIDGGDGDDTIDGGADNDVLFGRDGNDIINGGAGADTIDGGAGDDEIMGGAGDDTIIGGAGDDTITGWLGNDLLQGGGGNDVFTYAPRDGHDTILDFNAGNTGALGDGDTTNNDFVDLSSYYDSLAELHADQADDGVLNQSNAMNSRGVGVDYSNNTRFGEGSIRILGASADRSSLTADNTGVVCFTCGTAIRTPGGDVLIDDLRIDDLVTTLDNGPQRIRWIGKRRLGGAMLQANPNMRPILIRGGVLGAERDLLVSPQHGMLVDQGTQLVRAKHLAETTPGVRIANGKKQVTYVHLMFDTHQIIFAENAPSESFYPGPMALKMMNDNARDEVFALFPNLATGLIKQVVSSVYGETVRDFTLKRDIKGCIGLHQ